jgi:simple sugar transport system ATP-binding protein
VSEFVIAADQVSKRFGAVMALHDVSVGVSAGSVTCVLGDNGAGKSTLMGILSGVTTPDNGKVMLDGAPIRFRGPHQALANGIATVYQDLALVSVLPVYRNFWLGHEDDLTRGPLRRFDAKQAKLIAAQELGRLVGGVSDVRRPLSTLSGGQRQSLAIARAIYFGARVIILDEPTAALGLRQAGVVLMFIQDACQRGIGVALITHNLQHALLVGDRFVVLEHGKAVAAFGRGERSFEEVAEMVSGGAEASAMREALERARAEVGHEIARTKDGEAAPVLKRRSQP